MPKRNTRLDLSVLTVPPTAARTFDTVFQALRPAAWAQQVAARVRPPERALFAAQLIERGLASETPGTVAEDFALRLMPEETRRRDETNMALATYAPPQRQISAARQGASEWWNE